MPRRKVTSADYFSPAQNQHFMGSSQFKAFQRCEAAALAEINGEYKRETTTALLVGSYVDAHFSRELDIFKAQHPELFTRNGELKADYKHAEYIIERIKRDEMFMRYLSGGKQRILTRNIAGVPFKIKIDSYHIGKAIVDLKIVKDFAGIWEPGQGKLSFIEYWGYDTQGAIYQAVEGHKLPFYIAAATKEKPEPDIGIFYVPQAYIDVALENVEKMAPRYQAIKLGKAEPTRCEHCDYCKKTKKLSVILSMEDLKNA